MNKKISIQIKAAFLIGVFSLNTVIGFACAIGIDIGFNTAHHHDDEATEVTIHVHQMVKSMSTIMRKESIMMKIKIIIKQKMLKTTAVMIK